MSLSCTASMLGLQSCPVCTGLCRADTAHAKDSVALCPRCHAHVHPRKPASLQRTWALLVAALALYVPSNLWPVIRTRMLGDEQTDTIMSGVVSLWQSGSWPLALLVFVASIVVPGLKLGTLALLCLSVQPWGAGPGWPRLRRLQQWQPHQRTRLYRMVELIGRWSMLDIFVVAVSVAMVRSPAFAEVSAEPGAMAFAAVVVLTMLASASFDPRLIWDAAGRGRDDAEIADDPDDV